MKKVNFHAIVALMLISATAFTTTSCIRLRNKTEQAGANLGKVITKNYDLSDFNKLDLSGVGNVHITQGNTYSVKVSAQEKLFDAIDISKKGKELVVDLPNNQENTGRSFSSKFDFKRENLNVYITMPDITDIDQSGVVNVEIAKPIKVDKLTLYVSGVGNTRINGLTANDFSADISGVGSVSVQQLTAKTSSFDVSGVGNVTVEYNHSGYSEVETSGVGSVTLSGTLRKLQANKSNITSKISNNTQIIK